MLRIGICDDERVSAEALYLTLEPLLGEDEEIIYEFTNGVSAANWLERHPGEMELLFLDVEMKPVDGIKTAERIRTFDRDCSERIPGERGGLCDQAGEKRTAGSPAGPGEERTGGTERGSVCIQKSGWNLSDPLQQDTVFLQRETAGSCDMRGRGYPFLWETERSGEGTSPSVCADP